jgi:hypothetical protein
MMTTSLEDLRRYVGHINNCMHANDDGARSNLVAPIK